MSSLWHTTASGRNVSGVCDPGLFCGTGTADIPPATPWHHFPTPPIWGAAPGQPLVDGITLRQPFVVPNLNGSNTIHPPALVWCDQTNSVNATLQRDVDGSHIHLMSAGPVPSSSDPAPRDPLRPLTSWSAAGLLTVAPPVATSESDPTPVAVAAETPRLHLANGAAVFANALVVGHGANAAVVGDASTPLPSNGLLPPRVSSAERTAITNLYSGLIVYDTDLDAVCYVDAGLLWRKVESIAI